MTGSAAGEPRPDIGDEITRLSEALQGWWTSVGAGAPAPQPEGPPSGHRGEDRQQEHDHEQQTDHDHDHEHEHEHERADGHTSHRSDGASCRVCPVCRTIDVVRAVRPELLLQVASAAETVALLLREAAVGPDEAPDPDDGDAPFERGTSIEVNDGGVSTQGDDRTGDAPWA